MSSSEPDPEGKRSILRQLVFNQYQAIVLAGVAAISILSASPLPLLVWAGGELALLPLLDSGPLRRTLGRRRLAKLQQVAELNRARALSALDPAHGRRFTAMQQMCSLIEANYQQLHGLSQAYLTEQRGKLDVILDGCLHRLLALQRYDAMLERNSSDAVERQVQLLGRELQQPDLPDRARVAIEKNIELKTRLLKALDEARGTIKALATELDSMASLLEVIHQNSIAMRDPQAVSQELDAIARQSEDSERVVQEMEALVGSVAVEWPEFPPVPASVNRSSMPHAGNSRKRDKNR